MLTRTTVTREQLLRVLAEAMSERELQTRVIELAHRYGWLVTHFRPAQTAKGWRTPVEGDKGFPDLCMARGGQVIFVELKSQKGKLTPEEDAWLAAIDKYWAEPWFLPPKWRVYLWRPSDLLSGEIERVLA